jgi:hypothetical protein
MADRLAPDSPDDLTAAPRKPVPGPGDPGVTRRTFLRRAVLGAGTLLVVGTAALGYRAYDEGVFSAGDGAAFDPWRTWQDQGGPVGMVAAGILAANPHNTQPWRFRVRVSQIDVYADPARNLGAADPLRRELYVGLGCALENLVLAGEAGGYRSAVVLMPDPRDPAHVARVTLTRGAPRASRLHEAIPDRHTDRAAFRSGRAVPPAGLEEMARLADGLPGTRLVWFADEAGRRRVGDLLIAATDAFIADEAQSKAAFAWFRQDWDHFMRVRDGVNVDTAGLSDLTTSLAKILPRQSRDAGDRAWRDATRDTQVATAAAYGVVTVPDARSNAARLAGGRLLERVHLWAAANGLALQHMNQVTERADRERQLGIRPRFGAAAAGLIDGRDGQWLAAFRIGYPTGDARRGPRRGTDAVIVA